MASSVAHDPFPDARSCASPIVIREGDGPRAALCRVGEDQWVGRRLGHC